MLLARIIMSLSVRRFRKSINSFSPVRTLTVTLVSSKKALVLPPLPPRVACEILV